MIYIYKTYTYIILYIYNYFFFQFHCCYAKDPCKPERDVNMIMQNENNTTKPAPPLTQPRLELHS